MKITQSLNRDLAYPLGGVVLAIIGIVYAICGLFVLIILCSAFGHLDQPLELLEKCRVVGMDSGGGTDNHHTIWGFNGC
jgi:hypothetical protein